MSEYEGDVVGVPSEVNLEQVTEMANKQIQVEAELAHLEDLVQLKGKELRKISQDLLPDLMQEVGMNKFELLDGSTVELVDKLNASIKKDAELDALAYLRDQGDGYMIKSTIKAALGMEEDDKIEGIAEYFEKNKVVCEIKASVPPSTLKKYVKGCLADGKRLPLELFSIFEFRESKIKKGKK